MLLVNLWVSDHPLEHAYLGPHLTTDVILFPPEAISPSWVLQLVSPFPLHARMFSPDSVQRSLGLSVSPETSVALVPTSVSHSLPIPLLWWSPSLVGGGCHGDVLLWLGTPAYSLHADSLVVVSGVQCGVLQNRSVQLSSFSLLGTELWWCAPVIPVPRKWCQEEQKFEAGLGWENPQVYICDIW